MDIHEIFELTADKRVILKKPYAEVHIPEDYVEHGIASIIGEEVETFGLFDVYVWETEDKTKNNPVKVSLTFSSKIRTVPSRIDRKKVGEEGEYILEYVQGDLFIKSTQIAKSGDVSRAFIDILFKGYIPDSLSYDDMHDFWNQCNNINGINLNVSDVVTEMILATFARDPHHMEIPFRIALSDKRKGYNGFSRKMVRVTDIPRFNSTFASLSSGDPKQGITTSINRHRSGAGDNPSPIEDAIL